MYVGNVYIYKCRDVLFSFLTFAVAVMALWLLFGGYRTGGNSSGQPGFSNRFLSFLMFKVGFNTLSTFY